jgi:hypothetical protein
MNLPEFWRQLEAFWWRQEQLARMLGCEIPEKKSPEDLAAMLGGGEHSEDCGCSECQKFDQLWEKVEAQRGQ